MIKNKTVIISCAGMGKRLGLGTTKALINVEGESLIIRTLKLLNDVEDVRVVVGFQADKVISAVKEFRKDVVFVMNNNYMNTGTAGSVSLALEATREYILTIDGDLIIHPEDMDTILKQDGEFVCGSKIESDDPVKVTVKDGNVVEFSRDKGDFEWTGICCIKSKNVVKSDRHVYQMVEPILPLKHLFIRTREIDTMDDYYRAVKWVKNGFKDEIVIGILGGMGSYATLNTFKKYLDKFVAEKEWDRPRVIIDNNCTMPSRVRAIIYNENRELLIREMCSSTKNLIQAGATDIFFACNTSHYFMDEIKAEFQNYSGVIHNIIEECIEYLKTLKKQDILILASEGTIQANVYGSKDKNLKFVYDNEDFKEIREFIESVKQNKITEEILIKFTEFLNSKKENVILLGCTELPVLYDLCSDNVNKLIIDPIDIVLDNLYKKFKSL